MSFIRTALFMMFFVCCSFSVFAQNLEIFAADQDLEKIVSEQILGGIVYSVYQNTSSAKDLLERIDKCLVSLKLHRVLLSSLSADDKRRQNVASISGLEKILTAIKSGLMHDGYAAAVESIKELHSQADLMLNSIRVDMVIEVARFSTDFKYGAPGSAIGRRIIDKINGRVFYDDLSENLSNMARFRDFLRANAGNIKILVTMPLTDKNLIELEKHADIYGYPDRKGLSIVGTVRLLHIVGPNVNLIAPELISIKKISYR